MVAFRTLSALLELADGSLASHIKSTGISMPLLCTQWFVSLYLHVLPTPVVFKLWDVAFAALALQGDSATPEPPSAPAGKPDSRHQAPAEAASAGAAGASEGGAADGGASAARTSSLLAVLHAAALAIFQRVRASAPVCVVCGVCVCRCLCLYVLGRTRSRAVWAHRG